jgi:hypothetical protein
MFDGRTINLIANHIEFETLTTRIVSKFWRLIEERYVVHASAPGVACRQLMGRIFTCYLVNRISPQFFVSQTPAVGALIQEFFQAEKWQSMQRYSQDSPALMKGVKVLETAVEVLSHSIVMSTFAQTFHYILRTVEILAATLPKENSKDLPQVVAWVVTHSDIEKLMQCYYFVTHFFRDKAKLFDIIGGLDIASWDVFGQFFLAVQKLPSRGKGSADPRAASRTSNALRAPS